MNDIVLKYLKEKGYSNISTDYYDYIELWERWWRNEVDFHVYHDPTGKKRKMHTAGMAKRISEDWASILYSERDEITTEANTSKLTKANNEFLNKQIKLLKIHKDLPTAIEKAMASGTAGAIVRIKNVKIDKENNLIASDKTKLDIIYVSASQIIPLRVEHGEIIDVAIVSENNKGKDKEYYIETHKLKYSAKEEQEIYEISNTYLDYKGKEIQKENIAKGYTIKSSIPLFSIMKPAIANPINENYNIINGMGFSIYGSAIDQLMATDIAWHNFVMDFYLGGKKVFYNKKIVGKKIVKTKGTDGQTKEEVREVYPDDVTRQQWQTYGDEQANLKDEPAVTEYNPDLRVEDNKNGIQFALDFLSFKAGLGTKYYEFNGSSIVTATQYAGDRQDLVKNANKHRRNVDSFISGICKAVLLLGRVLLKQPVTEDCVVNIVDKDGFLVDTETAKAEFRQDIAMGIRQPWEYRVKFYGEDEKTAKAMVQDEEIENIEESNKKSNGQNEKESNEETNKEKEESE